MVSECATPDLAMLRWIAYIKSLNPEIRHIYGKDNAMADMLSRARFDDEGGMVSKDEEVGVDFFEAAHVVEYQCIMVVFTPSSLSAQVRAIYVNRIKGSCPK